MGDKRESANRRIGAPDENHEQNARTYEIRCDEWGRESAIQTNFRRCDERQSKETMETMGTVRHFRDLSVYQNAMSLSLEIYELTKAFPVEKKYSLTDQVRRSSRSICANIAEAWRKKRYAPAFVSKLSDAEAEAAETQVWLEMAHKIGFLDEDSFLKLDDKYDHVIRQLVRMINEPRKWCITKEGDRS